MPTPSPIPPSPGQAATIAALVRFGQHREVNVTVDAAPLDVDAHEPCAHDWSHGPGTVCLPNTADRLCPPCAAGWLYLHGPGHVALDVLRDPTGGRRAA